MASRVAAGELSGLSIRLYHPDSCPSDISSFEDERGDFHARSRPMAVRWEPRRSEIGSWSRAQILAHRTLHW